MDSSMRAVIRLESHVISRLLNDFKKIADAYGVEATLVLLNGYDASAGIAINKGIRVGINAQYLKAQDDPDCFAFLIAHELAHHHYGEITCRGHEYEYRADKLAVQKMQECGFNPDGAIRFFETFPQNESPSHPSSRDRIAAIKKCSSRS